MKNKTGIVNNIPNSTAQKIDILPSKKKKSKKLISAKPPSIIDVVSPTKVAAPCKLEATEMLIITGIGEIFSFLDIAKPIGASIKTVATLSINAETTPLIMQTITKQISALGIFVISMSASFAGILDSINKPTIIIIPKSINKTL